MAIGMLRLATGDIMSLLPMRVRTDRSALSPLPSAGSEGQNLAETGWQSEASRRELVEMHWRPGKIQRDLVETRRWPDAERQDLVETPCRRTRAARGAITGIVVGAGLWGAILVAARMVGL